MGFTAGTGTSSVEKGPIGGDVEGKRRDTQRITQSIEACFVFL